MRVDRESENRFDVVSKKARKRKSVRVEMQTMPAPHIAYYTEDIGNNQLSSQLFMYFESLLESMRVLPGMSTAYMVDFRPRA